LTRPFGGKFALAAFTFDLAELAGSEITVNCLHPASLMNTLRSCM
jgi:NAD(P)-dependent dehydrogenase (short-subunit alcohol dehydrogenase family)